MIGTLSINLNSANPNVPLKTLFAFVDSPSSLRIIDVPKKIGKWNITNVYVAATYPDNQIVSVACVLTGGCWTGTIAGSTSVGRSLNGYVVSASGTDENGDQIDGYVLGKGDVCILDADGRTIIDGKVTYLHLLDETPEDPKEGDVICQDDDWKIYHENEWIDFGGKNPVWGTIEGDIDDQTDLKEKFDGISGDIGTLQSDVSQLKTKVTDVEDDIDNIHTAMTPTAPSTDASDTALAGAKSTADFVNSSINNFAAFYMTKNANGDAFATKAELTNATVYYSGGQVRVPTKNDYCIVLEDETKTTALGVNPTTRYTYNGQWEFQYIVNNTALTQAQVNAINSGITSSKVVKIDEIDGKRDKTDNICHKTTTAYSDWSRDNLPQIPDNTWDDQPYWNIDFNVWLWNGTAAHAQKFGGTPDDCSVNFYYESASSSGWFVTTRVYLGAVATKDRPYVTYDIVASEVQPLSTIVGYADTLLSGVTEDDQEVSFYILTKAN